MRRAPVAAAAAVLLAFVPGSGRAQVSPGPLAKPHAHLEGNAHCTKCHAPRDEGMDSRCLACHKPIARLRSAGRGLHARTGDVPCARCHPDHAGVDFALIEWEDGSPERFDHRRAGWPLEGKHAQKRCADCHQPKFRKGASKGWLGLDPACGSCHEDPHRGALGGDCGRCHDPSGWKNTPAFDHGATAFPLAGKHAATPCAKCHQPEGRATPVYKPLPHAECSACHADPHGGRLGPSCASCHNPSSFRDVPKTAFDHGRTRYPLLGAHRAVPCARCHDPRSGWGPRPAFATCGGCHRDPHAGQATLAGAQVDCASCHDVAGFRPGTLDRAKHAIDRFPLEGRHARVACAECHRRDERGVVRMRPLHDRCLDCHEDAHGGQLVSRPDRGECSACHDASGWRPSRFGVREHGDLSLPLLGAHARIPCAACHGPQRAKLGPLPPGLPTGTARIALRGIERECAACHRDPHRFEPARECSDCHDATAFVPARVGVAEHGRFAFPLTGAHRAVPCVACHESLRGVRTGTSDLTFRDPRRECAQCHADPHGGQFGSGTAVGCERCHGDDSFRPASRFDHDRDSSFRLGLGHASVPCARCHPSSPGAGGGAIVRYRGVPSKCAACHGSKTPIEGDPS